MIANAYKDRRYWTIMGKHTRKHRKPRCATGKIRYHDRDSAQLALASCRGSVSRNRAESRVYQCHVCNGWHLTSKTVAHHSTMELRKMAPEAVQQGMRVTRITKWSPHESSRFVTCVLHQLDGSGISLKAWAEPWMWRKLRSIVEDETSARGVTVCDIGTTELSGLISGYLQYAVKAYTLDHKGWATPQDTLRMAGCWSEEMDAWNCPARLWVLAAADVYDMVHGSDSSTPVVSSQ